MLRLAQQKGREGAGIPGGCSSQAKGLGEDATNGAAARPVVAAAREGRKSKGGERESPREGKKETKGGDR